MFLIGLRAIVVVFAILLFLGSQVAINNILLEVTSVTYRGGCGIVYVFGLDGIKDARVGKFGKYALGG